MKRFVVATDGVRVLVTDTITVLESGDADAIVVSGSHGGVSSAQFVMGRGLRAVFFNDAGIGKDAAGVASLGILAALGMPALAVSCESARIGDGEDTWKHGTVSRVNDPASLLGARSGQSVQQAVRALTGEMAIVGVVPGTAGSPLLARTERLVGSELIVLIDSISMVRPSDTGRIVVSGSHGGAVSGEFAARHRPRLTVFNDAGVGKDDAGVAALRILQLTGDAAVSVTSGSGRIGDPADMLEHGVVSHVNAAASDLGFVAGVPLLPQLQIGSVA